MLRSNGAQLQTAGLISRVEQAPRPVQRRDGDIDAEIARMRRSLNPTSSRWDNNPTGPSSVPNAWAELNRIREASLAASIAEDGGSGGAGGGDGQAPAPREAPSRRARTLFTDAEKSRATMLLSSRGMLVPGARLAPSLRTELANYPGGDFVSTTDMTSDAQSRAQRTLNHIAQACRTQHRSAAPPLSAAPQSRGRGRAQGRGRGGRRRGGGRSSGS